MHLLKFFTNLFIAFLLSFFASASLFAQDLTETLNALENEGQTLTFVAQEKGKTETSERTSQFMALESEPSAIWNNYLIRIPTDSLELYSLQRFLLHPQSLFETDTISWYIFEKKEEEWKQLRVKKGWLEVQDSIQVSWQGHVQPVYMVMVITKDEYTQRPIRYHMFWSPIFGILMTNSRTDYSELRHMEAGATGPSPFEDLLVQVRKQFTERQGIEVTGIR
ncbi:MAG: hypothetical protein AAGI38_20090 [Bacteroidota bacterium]